MVTNCERHYGDTFVTVNVHSLLHLADDVRNHNCSLNYISAFSYKNYLQTLKGLFRDANNPITQVLKRLAEQGNIVSKDDANITQRASQCFNKLPRSKDSRFMTDHNNLVFVTDVIETDVVKCIIMYESSFERFLPLLLSNN